MSVLDICDVSWRYLMSVLEIFDWFSLTYMMSFLDIHDEFRSHI